MMIRRRGHCLSPVPFHPMPISGTVLMAIISCRFYTRTRELPTLAPTRCDNVLFSETLRSTLLLVLLVEALPNSPARSRFPKMGHGLCLKMSILPMSSLLHSPHHLTRLEANSPQELTIQLAPKW